MENLFSLFYECSSVCTDTRKIEKKSLFICLSGPNFDGNQFAGKALELGAKYVISDNKVFCDEKAIFFVNNTLFFLQKLANYHRKKFNVPLIGITGSNGKTSTKELINTVLSKKYKTVATEGNLNNHIGVPLTLLRIDSSHEIAIIEMGANRFKDIEELCDICEPTHGIITNIGKAHLEGFGNFEGVLKTKKELYASVNKNKGVIFYNLDDAILVSNLPNNTKLFSFGSSVNANIEGQLIELNPFIRMKWKSKDFQSDEIQTSLIGKYNFYNFLAAISFGVYFKVDNNDISKAVSEYTSTNNRSQIKKTESNTLILDAYNANPSSMNSALESFGLMNDENKLVILGDMFELGEDSLLEHQAIINKVVELDLKAIFIGERFFNSKQNENSNFSFFKTKDEFMIFLSSNAIKNSLILLKGSRGIGLEVLGEIL